MNLFGQASLLVLYNQIIMDWQVLDGKLTKEFGFKDFGQAMLFVNKVAELAEVANHHPDITIHSYNKVRLQLFSHDQAIITDKDYNLANKIDAIYN